MSTPADLLADALPSFARGKGVLMFDAPDDPNLEGWIHITAHLGDQVFRTSVRPTAPDDTITAYAASAVLSVVELHERA